MSIAFYFHIKNSLYIRHISRNLPFWRSYHLRKCNQLVRYKWHDCAWNYLFTFRHRCRNCFFGILDLPGVNCSLDKGRSCGVHAPACSRYRGIKYRSPIVSIHPYSFYEYLLSKAAPGIQLELF